MHMINLYPVDSMVYFKNIYPLNGNLSGGQPYPAFKQLGPSEERVKNCELLTGGLSYLIHYTQVIISEFGNLEYLTTDFTLVRLHSLYLLK